MTAVGPRDLPIPTPTRAQPLHAPPMLRWSSAFAPPLQGTVCTDGFRRGPGQTPSFALATCLTQEGPYLGQRVDPFQPPRHAPSCTALPAVGCRHQVSALQHVMGFPYGDVGRSVSYVLA